MTTKELSQLYHLNREIERDQKRLKELEAAASGCAINITGMPHAPGVSDKVGRFAAEIADLRGIISANYQRCMYELNRLNRYISSIEDSYIRQIFQLRYVSGLSWQQVALCMGGNNTEDSVRKAHRRYLSAREKLSDLSAESVLK